MVDFGQYGKRRRVSGGIQSRNKRGAFGQTWWGRHFVTAMEGLSEPGRIARGRTYARDGQVLRMTVERGVIRGAVQGSQLDPFDAAVYVEPLTDAEIAALIGEVRANPGMLAELASNAIPQALGAVLLPQHARQLDFDCSCPDDGWPCKHAAALMYIAAEHIDASALTILNLRGTDLDTLIGGVGESEDTRDSNDWFGDRTALPALPHPGFAPAIDDLDPAALRTALRSGGIEEALVRAGIADLHAFYRRLGE